MQKFFVFLSLMAFMTEYCAAQVCGCTDSLASNYNATATLNDGSCIYDSTIIYPVAVGELDTILDGTSSLFYWTNNYWTFNDWFNKCLYRIDSTDASITYTLCLKGLTNHNIEEITQDSLYLYLGSFGNNHGNRHDLHVLRIKKSSLWTHSLEIDTIWFSYEDQTNFSLQTQNHDFDCEAFIATDDSLYLFTKQWVSEHTSVYAIPKVPGSYIAHRNETYNVKGLITGASYFPDYRLIVLCGYDYDDGDYWKALHPFIFLLYDFQEHKFFSGNKRRLDFEALTKAQVEAIASTNALDFFITNEHFHKNYGGVLTIDLPAKLQRLNLRDYLLPYLSRFPNFNDSVSSPDTSHHTAVHDLQNDAECFFIYPNPAKDKLHIDLPQEFQGAEYVIFNHNGQRVAEGVLNEKVISLGNRNMPAGHYLLTVRKNRNMKTMMFIKTE